MWANDSFRSMCFFSENKTNILNGADYAGELLFSLDVLVFKERQFLLDGAEYVGE